MPIVWLVSFPEFACPLVLYIPCAFSALAARPICVRAVLSLFPVFCSLHSFPFFPRLQLFQFLPPAIGNCFSSVIRYFFVLLFFGYFFVTIIFFIDLFIFLNLLPCPADHAGLATACSVFSVFCLWIWLEPDRLMWWTQQQHNTVGLLRKDIAHQRRAKHDRNTTCILKSCVQFPSDVPFLHALEVCFGFVCSFHEEIWIDYSFPFLSSWLPTIEAPTGTAPAALDTYLPSSPLVGLPVECSQCCGRDQVGFNDCSTKSGALRFCRVQSDFWYTRNRVLCDCRYFIVIYRKKPDLMP